MTRRIIAAAAALLLAAPLAAQSQQKPDSMLFAVRIGQDTSRYMWLVRDGALLTSVSANRIPSLHVLRGETVLNAAGAVERLEQLRYAPPGDPSAEPAGGTRITAHADSTVVQYGLTPESRRLSFPDRGHFINTSHYFESLATLGRYIPAQPGDSIVGWHYAGTLFPPQRFVVRRTAADAATAWSRPLGTVRLRLDERGEVLEFDGAGTSALNFTGTRIAWRDIDETIAELMRQEAAGKRFGTLSPADSLHAEIAGARLSVRYNRPYKRGRAIFGNIVPWGQIWRTGANRATVFATDRPLRFGEAVLAAGEYTLWTLPTEAGWTLILNAQTGQWGTEHDPARDVLRVPMTAGPIPDTVEQLEILLEPDGDAGGRIRIRWDQLEASAPFTVADDG